MGSNEAELPAWVSEPDDLPLENLTHVGDVDRLSVFASRDDDDNWCVVLVIEPTSGSDGSDWAAGASCSPPEAFATDGVWVKVASSSYSGAALLLPDDFNGDVGADWEQINDNLAVRH